MSAVDITTLAQGRKGQPRVLLVGDYAQDFFDFMAAQRDYAVDLVLDSGQAAGNAGMLKFDVVVTGLKIQPVDGMGVMRAFRGVDPDAPVILCTHETSPKVVVEAMRAGAFDYIIEPFESNALIKTTIDRAATRRRTLLAARKLSGELHRETDLPGIVGRSAAFSELRKSVRRAADSDSPVLITGESGTGKGLVARALHEASGRAGRPFVTVNCGAIPETLLESELFGHARGAFTGAVADRQGRVQQADGGSLFLDEIAELSPSAQVKLLRFIEEHSFERVGDSSPLSADVRVISATNQNLPARLASGIFREDLFYRVNVLSLEIPPLRERKEDVALLAQHFLEIMAAESGKDVRAVSPRALEALEAHAWPGNARELRNVLERAFVFTTGDTILYRDIPADLAAVPVAAAPRKGEAPAGLREHLRREERRAIVAALEACDWVRAHAAKRLKIPRSTLIRKMRELKISQ